MDADEVNVPESKIYEIVENSQNDNLLEEYEDLIES